MRAYAELWIALALTIVSLVALLGAGWGGWRGALDQCVVGDQCFCERAQAGLIAERANTLSNLGFIAAGLGIAWQLGRERRRGIEPAAKNPMTTTRFYPGFYAAIVALLGPGSMALHASVRAWGGVLDIVSMNLYIGFLFSYAAMRWLRAGRGAFVAIWVAVNLILLINKLTLGGGSAAFGIMAGLALLLELRLRQEGRLHADGRWLVAGGGIFALAFAIWLPSRTGGPLCFPDSLLQGHAAWHLLCAAATVTLFEYSRSESSLTASVSGPGSV